MAYTVLYNDEGLVGVTNEPAQGLLGVSYITVDAPAPDLNISVWNKETLQFDLSVTQISKREFLSKFTLIERSNIRASTDAIVMDLMFLLDAATYIDLTDISLIQGVNYLAMIGLIAPNRVQEILGGS